MKITPTKSVCEGWNGTVAGVQALAKSLERTPKLTKFDRQVITEAYGRCYGLRDAVQAQTRGWHIELAHQTGYRATWLKKHAEEVRGI